MELIVAIRQKYEVFLGIFKSCAQCRAISVILWMLDELHTRIFGRPLIDDVRRLVAAAVIHDDHFVINPVIFPDLDALLDHRVYILSFVVAGKKERNGGERFRLDHEFSIPSSKL